MKILWAITLGQLTVFLALTFAFGKLSYGMDEFYYFEKQNDYVALKKIRDTDHQNRLLVEGARAGSLNIIQKALKEGANVNFVSNGGKTALFHAAINGHSRIISLLLKSGANANLRDRNDNTALHYAALYCRPRVAYHLIRSGMNLNWGNRFYATPLIWAAENGCAPVVQDLVSHQSVKLNAQDIWFRTAYDYAKAGFDSVGDKSYERILKLLRNLENAAL